MMTSGSSAYRVGGLGPLSSSLSSNLSPLAPPFEVDKSLKKQNSTNTAVNYPDILMYGPYSWNHSSSVTRSTFSPTELMSAHATSSSSTVYGYSVSQPSTTVSNVYSGSTDAYDPFSYHPFPKSMPTAPEEDVQPYYSPYMASPPHKDDFLSLGINSGDDFAHKSDCVSSAANHTQQRLWDRDRKLNWGGFWSGVNEQSKWSEYAQGVVSKDSNLSYSTSSKSPFFVDGSNKSQPSIDADTHPLIDGIRKVNVSDAGNESNPRQDDCFDIFGGACNPGSLGIDQQDSDKFNGWSRDIGLSLPNSISSSKPEENSYLQDPVVESVTNSYGSQKFNAWSRDNHISQNGVYAFGCTSTATTFPITKSKLPYDESLSSAEGVVTAMKPNHKVSLSDEESNISARYDLSYPVDLQIPVGLTRQSSIIRRPSSTSVVTSSSSQMEESSDCRIGSKKPSKTIQVSPQKSLQFNADGVDHEINDAQPAYSISIGKPFEGTDTHNPTEDSPCWRGASSSSFSPFTMSKVMVPDVFDEGRSVSTHAPQPKSFPAYTSGSEVFISEKAKERNTSEGPLVQECVPKGTEERYTTNHRTLCFDLNTGEDLQSTEESYAFAKDHCILNKSETDAFPGIQKSETAAFERGSNRLPGAANNSLDAPTSSENHGSSPPGDNASLYHSQETIKISDSNIDVNLLLKTLSDLSEMLRCYCFSKRASVPQQYSITIKQIIANLDASLLMTARDMSSSMLSSEVISSKQEVPLVQMVNDAAFETVAGSLLESVSCKQDPNTIGDVDMTVAIKKILHDNFLGKEMDQQKLLYKSLWLDAEASLCAMTAKARFVRVKADMEKAHDGTKDKEISSSSLVSGDVHGTVGMSCQNNHADVSEVNKCQIPNIQVVDVITPNFEGVKATKERSPILSSHVSKCWNVGSESDDLGSTNHAKAVEDTVTARYQILKGRIEHSEAPIQENKESFGEQKDPPCMYACGFDSHDTAGRTSDSVEIDNPAMNKYQRLTCRGDHSAVDKEYNDLSNRDPSNPINQMLECGNENFGSLHKGFDFEEGRASITGRFQIIQTRIQNPDAVVKGHINGSALKLVEDDRHEAGFPRNKNQTVMSAFGQNPSITNIEHVTQFGVRKPLLRDTDLSPKPCKTNRLNSEILESWYGSDRSSSDWEHVSKKDSRKA